MRKKYRVVPFRKGDEIHWALKRDDRVLFTNYKKKDVDKELVRILNTEIKF